MYTQYLKLTQLDKKTMTKKSIEQNFRKFNKPRKKLKTQE